MRPSLRVTKLEPRGAEPPHAVKPPPRFATPGVKIGLFCSTPMVALTRAIGRKRALEMLLTGKAIDARNIYQL